MNRKQSFLILAILIFVGWLFATPYVAAYQLYSAIDRQDVSALPEFVNFDAVKNSVKTQLDQKILDPIKKEAEKNPLAGIALMIAGGVVNQATDQIISPQGMVDLMKGSANIPQAPQPDKSSPTSKPETKQAPSPSTPGNKLEKSMGYESLNSFVISLKKGAEQDKPIKLIMQRQGLVGWKIEDVRLPL